MSDFLKLVNAKDAPEPREIEINGETVTFYVRKLSAGQSEAISKGITLRTVPGAKAEVDIEWDSYKHQRQLKVLYSVCDEDGKRYFKNIDAVQALQDDIFVKLADAVDSINVDGQEDEPGKA